MKSLLSLLAFLVALTALAMPLKWDCNFPEAKAQTFSVYQGETVTFEPTFRVNGQVVDLDIEGIYYQTNDMADSWWKLDDNTFAPTNDVGAAAYRFFIQAAGEGGKNYRANGTLRMLPSPGFEPNTLALPIHTLDFSQVDIKNAPWPDGTKVDELQGSVDDLDKTVDSLSKLIYGDDCRLISTDYNSKTKMPSLSVEFKVKDDASGSNIWYKVWDEMTRFNYLIYDYLPENYYSKLQLDAILEQKADRAWGFYDSHTGNFAPEGYTWISSPKIAIAGGMAYQRILTTSGAIWVLESNGLVTEVGGESDTGFFRISDDKGNALFEITKGSEQIAPANAGGCTTRIVMGVTRLDIPYYIESAEHPKLEISRDLKTWYAETDESCPVNVAWSGISGAYSAEVWGKQPESKLFVRASYKKGAEDKIVNSAPVEFTKLVIGGVTYSNLRVETIDGKKVLVLE